MNAPTIPGRLFQQGKNRPTTPALFSKENGQWVPTTWKAYAENTRQVGRALLSLGVGTGDVICILGNNRSEWVEADVGAMAIGAIPAGIYQTCSAEEIHYILEHSEAPLVIVENQAQWDKVAEVRSSLPNLKKIVTMRGTEIDDEHTLSWQAFIDSGNSVSPHQVDDAVSELKADQAATFIYTSGTTGPPKAVMLSHGNLAWTADLAVSLVEQSDQDLSLIHISEPTRPY